MSRTHFPEEEKKHGTAGRHPVWNHDINDVTTCVLLFFAYVCPLTHSQQVDKAGIQGMPRDATGCHPALALGEGAALRRSVSVGEMLVRSPRAQTEP